MRACDTPDCFKKLRMVKLFSDFSDKELESIAPTVSEVCYDKEHVVFYERDMPEEGHAKVYFVLEGCVKLVKYSAEGESTIVRLASAGEFFGVTVALTEKPYPFSAEVLSDTCLMYIQKSDFERLILQYPKIAIKMVVELGEMLWFNYETHNQVVKKTDARVSKIILYHLKRDGAEEVPEGMRLKVNLPHEYIASQTGIAYEESVRIVSRLKKEHQCIQYLRGGKIIVTNLDELKLVAQTDEDSLFF